MLVNPIPDNLLLRAGCLARRTTRQLRHVVYDVGQHLWTEEAPVGFVLFPVRGVVSLQLSPGEGKWADFGLLGREGYAEVPFLMGADQTRAIAVALTPGEALVMEADLFNRSLANARFRNAMHQYARMHWIMLSRFSLCNRIHVIEKTIIGRLLLIQDRTQMDSFQLTQDFFARVLGVRKATVNRTATQLQQQGAIRYDQRGRLTILNRPQLERQACSCYHTIKAASDHLIAALGGL